MIEQRPIPHQPGTLYYRSQVPAIRASLHWSCWTNSGPQLSTGFNCPTREALYEKLQSQSLGQLSRSQMSRGLYCLNMEVSSYKEQQRLQKTWGQDQLPTQPENTVPVKIGQAATVKSLFSTEQEVHDCFAFNSPKILQHKCQPRA